ncbi:MAG: Dna2/Cas4 domain-containing protein [Candidatus Aminicenantes bacterium]|nr:Dna2/Cas4 domain-containing protein [Candidatus Aminicenantes bacterium]NIM83337.1 Dna2/Cas4 domain-containing protein [Candidatus Aminicenantes bacterium]NIN22696.1 Dna2/Cas4 domain-containing protein [Candidatus Aminicenantes bacterium]NIN46456.1 Dna2/Cas4 domain-containing protein [Candidatus Aminicenantes bacterium]NIN89308.1 Dna2/Cas4 domain-containing protein [Candidatus Aminicenantes bacterium]
MSIDITGFSFSAISTFKSCPRAFAYKYIKKLPEAFYTIEAYMGGCVHKTLEWAYNQRQEGYEPTLDMAWEQYKGSWNSGNFENIIIVKDDMAKEDYFNQGRDFIGYFFNHVFPQDKSTTLYLEHQFEMPMGEEIVYRGVIDRISKGVDGTIRVTDYKTGRVEHPLENLQLPSYALYIFQHNIDQEIELCFEDLREQRTMVVSFSRKELKRIKEELLQEIEQIRNTKEEDFITRPSMLCLWCGYNNICDNPHESVKAKRGESTGIDFQEACPLCGGRLYERKGKFGPFLGCSNFPQCRYTRDLGVDRSNPAADPQTKGEDICPECGSLLRKRTGKYGPFMGCSNYPECRFTRPII